MPIDPSIFLQGAALKQRNNEALLSSINNISDQALKREALAVEKAAKGFDLEKLAQGYQLKKNMGVEGTPQEKAAFDTFLQFQSAERAVDPVTGNLYPKFQWPGGGSVDSGASDIGTIHEFPQNAPKRTGFNLDAVMGSPEPRGRLDMPPQQFAGGVNPALDPLYDPADPAVNSLMNGIDRSGGAPPLQRLDASMVSGQSAPGGFNLEAIRPQITVPAELQNNPKAAQTYLDTEIKNRGDINKAGAVKTQEFQAEKQANRPKAEGRLKEAYSQQKNIDATIDEALKLVSGRTAGLGSAVKDIPLLGRGSKATDLGALIETLKADAFITTLQEMRDNSPTGGAVGNATEKEGERLAAAKAALMQEQSPDQLYKNLEKYKTIRAGALKRISDAFEKDHGYRPDFGAEEETPTSTKKTQSWQEYFQ